ncbi:hypothetical protein QA584_08735 [Anaerocolumna sp. AGMB13025]|uniref:hypothetical protein n=1 Tax=Anaerocolumna sp. AGMB13025 TaxID=3039116 RepID=UPI00241E6347|nr:hypothetical protein [Anaerocolumna sp. AGMB13025]WFR59157.1 hypothetical protein QA584_08735 [Anaerocolumna sp. AGMB13025]
MVKKKLNKKDLLLAAGVSLILICFIVVSQQYNSPQNVIKRTLLERYDIVNVPEIQLQHMKRDTYRLINAPADPVSGIPLENWRILSFGVSGMVYSAVSLDVPLDNAEKLNISIRLTDEQRERLNLLAEIEGISLEEAAKNILLEELNSE